MVAIANIDEVIQIIKKSKDPKIAAEALCKKYGKLGRLSYFEKGW